MKIQNLFMTLLLMLLLGSLAFAQDNVAIVVKLSGEVRVGSKDSFNTTAIKKGHVLKDGDKVETGPGAFCTIKFLDDKSLLRIKEKSSCIIEGKRKGNSIEKNIFAEFGSFFMSLFKQKSDFKVTTSTSVASVKGTKFWVFQLGQSGESRYVCTQGSIEVKNNQGKVLVKKGQTCIVLSRSSAPQVRLTRDGDIPPEDIGGAISNELDVEFTNASGEKEVLRIKLKKQE